MSKKVKSQVGRAVRLFGTAFASSLLVAAQSGSLSKSAVVGAVVAAVEVVFHHFFGDTNVAA